MNSIDVICCGCTIESVLDEYKIELEELYEYPKIKVIGYGEDKSYFCKECTDELQPLNMYFEDEEDFKHAKELIGEKVASLLSMQIEHCSHCKGQDIEHFQYVAQKEEIPVRSRGTDLYDFLYGNHLPEEFHDVVIPYLRCSDCGYGEPYHPKHNPDGGEFDYSDNIYTAKEIQEFWGFEEELIEIAKSYGINVSSEQIDDFIEYCSINPLLAAKHELANNLFEIVQRFFEDDKMVLKLNVNIELYRGRSRAKDNLAYEIGKMGMPPNGVASHGRYNLVGTSVLYMTTNKSGIPYEVEPQKNEVIDVATFVVNDVLLLFNIDEAFKDFSLYISKENEESIILKRNYLFTNFLASVCGEIGFDGIYYKGAGGKEYNNIALFEKALSKVQGKEKVETLKFKAIYDSI